MKTRVISAIVALAIVIPLFLLGGIPWGIAVAIVAALAYSEIVNLKESHHPLPNEIKILGFIGLEIITLSRFRVDFTELGIPYAAIAVLFLAMLIPSIFDKKDRYNTRDALYMASSIALLGLFFGLIILIENTNKWILLYLLLIATVTDSFAMIIGSLIGKHKLIPAVSPKKSVEGSIGGSLVGTIIATIYYFNVIVKNPTTGNVILIIFISLVLTILGQIGDLFFSKIKRENNIKDFSNIMPGHGGILDRLDSLSFIVLGYTIFVTVLKLIA